jgi:putative ribosome biogenesis GTPase RsgA
MSLKEKAKTITEIAGEGGFNQPEVSTVRWVRLEDAEQTLAELKQKLQQESMLKCKVSNCIHWENGDCSYGFAYRMHYCEKYRRVSEKFGELLKEEKEAKTT